MSILFDSVQIKGMTLRNRFVRSATYDGLAERNGYVSQGQLRLYEALARGGVGLIITGITYVHVSGQMSPVQNSLAGEDCIPGFRKLAETVHKGGAKIAVQLFHAGREVAKVYSPKRKEALAPSHVGHDPYFHAPHRAMTEEEIREIVRAFGDAAGRAREAGLDAVQLHAAHAYLLSQFLSPLTNRRTDRWGGNLENRLRLHREIYRNIRAKVGDDYPVLVKIGVQDGFPGGLEFHEGKRAAAHLDQWGFDALEISSGLRGEGYANSEFRTHIHRSKGEAYFRDWCREIKRKASAPVMMVGGLRTFALMEEVIRKGDADFVSLSRPFIREPGIVNEWRNHDRHRARCISCNQCFDALLKGEHLHCAQKKEAKQK
ncbi:MAG: NADH:flavin oxidoreductase [Deltaproteobacteria bacterium]|nr:NADH:flavin oxidoreductase [Deltaproteobacteria bacterium]